MPNRRVRGPVRALGLGAAVAACLVFLLSSSAPWARAQASIPPAAVVLLLDTSGSMVTSDPNGERAAASANLAQALPQSDLLGIITFSAQAKVVLPLGPVGAARASGQLQHALAGIGAYGGTNLLGALQAATTLLTAAPQLPAHVVVVLLTDGVPDVSGSSTPQYRSEMLAAASGMASRGWTLDTLGLGDSVNGALLAQLAQDGGGTYLHAAAASALVAGLATLGLPPPAPPPPPPPAPARVSLTLGRVPGRVRPGQTVTLSLAARNTGQSPVRLALQLTRGAGARIPREVTVPPGRSQVHLAVGVPLRGPAPATLGLRVRAPAGVALQTPTLGWRWQVEPAWRAALAAHRRSLAGGVLVASLLALAAGYLGWLLRVRPRLRLAGRFELTGPTGEALGEVALPARTRLRVGGADARPPVLAVAAVPGGETLFEVHSELEAGTGGAWLAGLRAWRHPPRSVLRARAAWPHHLYPGQVPQRTLDVYDATAFQVAGIRFTYRAPAEHAVAVPGGLDLLDGL